MHHTMHVLDTPEQLLDSSGLSCLACYHLTVSDIILNALI